MMNANETNNLSQAVPAWIKTGLIALVVLVIVFIIFSNSGESEDSLEVIPPADNTLLSEKMLDSTFTEDIDKSNSNALLAIEEQPGTTIEADVLEHGEQILAIQENGKINNRQISLILDQLKKLQGDFSKIPAQYDAQVIEIKHVNDSIVSMQGSLAKQEKMLTKKAASKKTYRRKSRKTPPFILVSIDRWGNDLTAIVRYQTQLQELRQGQTLSQWRVKSIDVSNSTVTFSHSAGDSKTLHIRS